MEEQGTGPPATPPAPAPAPPPSHTARTRDVPGGRLVQPTVIKAVIVLIGVLLLVAAILLQLVGMLSPSRFPSSEDYQNAVLLLALTGGMAMNVGMVLLFVYALLIGVLRTDLSDSTRKAFMAFALILFFFWWILIIFRGQILSSVPFPFP